MLSCKQVASLASDYLDNQYPDNNTPLKWKMRLHLMMCSNCRRFLRHLKITQQVGSQVAMQALHAEDVDFVLEKVHARLKQEAQTGADSNKKN